MYEKIEKNILTLLSKKERLTPGQIFAELKYPRRMVMQTINHLVRNEHLLFTYELGTAFVRRSYNKPVRVSEHIVLVPPNRSIPKELSSNIAIKIAKGAAFGDGHHPTTSLIIQLLDKTLYRNNKIAIKKALDIGTGSGVLAILAAKLGAENVIATDIDPIAIYEAQINVKINQLTDCITLIKSDEFPDNTYQLILANLRYPTLINIAEKLNQLIDKPGYVICSGYTNDESKSLTNIFKQHSLVCMYNSKQNKWAGGVFWKETM